MDKKLERSNKDKVLRRVAKNLKISGFIRTKPTFFVRVNGPLIEFVHFHKYTFGPSFRAHVCLRVINDPRDFIALLGFTSEQFSRPNSPNKKKYNFSYHKTEETVERCVQNIIEFMSEVAEPWFEQWRDYELLLNSGDSPLPEEERNALGEYLDGRINESCIERTKSLLKIA